MESLSAAERKEFEAFAAGIADNARALSLPRFRRPVDVTLKGDMSPVTAVDRGVESMLRERIELAWPSHGLLGEEYGATRMDAEYVWSIDPIDGTRSFISGWPLWGTLLALLRHGKPVLGVLDMPVLDERWIGHAGVGTTMNGLPCRTRACEALAAATLYTTTPDMFSPDEWSRFDRTSRAAYARRFGGDCYGYGMLAAGHIDAVVEANLMPYDYLAIAPVVEAAGGVMTDWEGRALGLDSGGRVVAAATPALHAALIESLARD
ncbi:inositol-phosphate phosphatase/L-galactose 1-phosphate phosphatase/histidinol-phosphatase [Luteibacter sp. W1I16]|jgi:histidinol phosphatase-like enzyme (inositol monophosphatase family)|uniref:histidinol-phosphatase n=1 Tax=Luteibacter sp. W1I16 TaxID=3373922 RepID=UPI003D1AE429